MANLLARALQPLIQSYRRVDPEGVPGSRKRYLGTSGDTAVEVVEIEVKPEELLTCRFEVGVKLVSSKNQDRDASQLGAGS